jgi:type II secretory pathway pseudopilin PulG
MNRRNATTLTEVLVAIFIMGIGLMAILSLFPLGAAQMAQALKDQRSAEAAANATSLARVLWKQACQADSDMFGTPNDTRPAFREGTSKKFYPTAVQRFIYAMDDPLFNEKVGSFPDYPASYPGPPVVIPPHPPATAPPGGFTIDPFIATVPNIPGNDGTGAPFMLPMPLTGPDANRSSYPVFVDMFGWRSATTASQRFWVGAPVPPNTPLAQPVVVNGSPTTKVGLIPRRPFYVRNFKEQAGPRYLDWQLLGTPKPDGLNPDPNNNWNNLQRIYKQFSLIDDMTFTSDGLPADSAGNAAGQNPSNPTAIERQGRYSWAYMFQRVRNRPVQPLPNQASASDTLRTQVDVSIVVYSGRSLDVPTDELAFLGYPPTGGQLSGSRQVLLQYSGAKPALRRGSWVLDASVFDSAGNINPQGKFYRVVNVEDGAGSLNIELQTPLATGPNTTPRVFIVMANVVEVFQIGEISPTSLPRNILDDQEY